ncbi:O-methyltransferase [Eikenella sp. S3360]|uniref:O-methyltransferase n=1 Tax=Eikenella glucosivorans TaxID=2766967 RepID=A0ABS0NCD3_9NEIS|nr:O-methyltransferase [Eikenella glucosivorans]MBH5329915.1 O-methyltransferase [Eikenella glucosivorans]
MNRNLKTYAENLYHQYHAHDQAQADRLNRWRSIEPESAELLSVLVLAKQAGKLLEIGTSGGYSTLHLADAARQTGGHLTSLEIDPDRLNTAKQHLANCHLSDRCTLLNQDAADFLRQNRETFDFVLLDAERRFYTAYWADLARSLAKPGSLIVVDNVLSHAGEVRSFIALVAQHPDFAHSILPVGAGLLLAARKP